MFDFFGLSWELRDQIYSNLLNETADHRLGRSLRLRVKNDPLAHLMLVSHQFSYEYLGEAGRHTEIVCLDEGQSLPKAVKHIRIPPALRSVRRLELRPWISWDSAHTEHSKSLAVPPPSSVSTQHGCNRSLLRFELD